MKIFLSKTMPMSLIQKQFRVSLDPLQGLGPFWSFQFRGYTGSSNYKNKRLTTQPVLVEEPSHSRSWSSYIFPTAVIVIAGAGVLLHYNDERRAIPKGAHQNTGQETRTINKPAFGGPFRLIDTEYRLVTENDLRGQWSLIYFGYTSSPDVGPEEVQKMAKATDILEHNIKIKPVFITIDPQRDSPSQLRAYLKEFDTRIVGLTGSIDAIRQTAQEYRVYFKKVEEDGGDYLVASSHNMYLMDPNMETVRCFTQAYNAEQLAEDILKEMKRSSNSDSKSNEQKQN
ncbi:protein SCO1 homolog 2, mitochondrial-like isoform X2 [Tasmannia lanceolata]|uniref:protein SCO1 homolog 2, mitochondrial-like isoform X2 n=1 Tax=Tasmannia lanceolata TaxID=3420 RepID=UPI0040642680